MNHIDEHGRTLTLTAEQIQITDVHQGLHAVLCGAGTAKTTTTAARVGALIGRGEQAGRILATTYGKAAAQELETRVRKNPAARTVQVGTIHHFGNAIINVARQTGLTGLAYQHSDNVERSLFIQARKALASQPAFKREVQRINEDEFFTYLEIMKGNLAYPDLRSAGLNAQHLKIATQAHANNPIYLELYREFERQRRNANLLTFNDMISGAWELLLHHPELLARVQSRYDHVMIDEYQDVNLAMSELLNLIAQRSRSYMVIGDDDQTIFSWRGSSTRFLRDFAERADVQTWRLSLNFRSTGNITALGNAVISQNRVRLPKQLVLTRGLQGSTHLHVTESQTETFLKEITAALTRYQPRDIAILIRRYGQTASLEHALLHHGIPYRVIGSAPFFERPEVKAVIAHLRLASFDARRSEGHQAGPQELADAAAALTSAYTKPSRFMSRAQADSVTEAVRLNPRLTFAQALTSGTYGNPNLVAQFAQSLHNLAQHVNSPTRFTRDLISELVTANGYLDSLRTDTPLAELGEEKVEAIIALQEFAGLRTINTFLDSLDVLTQKRLKEKLSDQTNVLTFMTTYRAKGLEWPCVFIPDADTDTYHARISSRDPSAEHKDVEEERRVFYVAVTRARNELHLLHEPRTTSAGTSRLTTFLTDVNAQQLIKDVERLKEIMLIPPAEWTAAEAYHVGVLTHRHHFGWWVQEQWDGDAPTASAVLHALAGALNTSGVTHTLSGEALAVWALFGDLPGRVPENLPELTAQLQGAQVITEYRTGDLVQHPQHGQGTVLRSEESSRGTLITVEFSALTQRYVAHLAGIQPVRTLN